MSASAASISRRSVTIGPRRPEMPGVTSQSDPLSRRRRTTSSGGSIVVEWQEDRRDSRDRLKIVHTDVRIRDRAADRLLGERDQLQHLERIEQPRREQRRVRIDANTPWRNLLVEPRE